VRYIPVQLQACKFKTNGSTEGRIDATVIVKSCKPASSKQMAIKNVSIRNRRYATVIEKREQKKQVTTTHLTLFLDLKQRSRIQESSAPLLFFTTEISLKIS